MNRRTTRRDKALVSRNSVIASQTAPTSVWWKWGASPACFACILLLACVIRLAHLLWIERSPLGHSPILDHQAYDAWAMRIASGEWPNEPFWVDPLYAYVLAGIYTVFGHSLTVVRILQSMAGVGIVALTARVAFRVTNSKTTANAAAVIAALYVPLIHAEAQIEKSLLATLLAVATLALVLEGTHRAIGAAGAMAGLAALTRANLLLWIPYLAAAILVYVNSERSTANDSVIIGSLRVARRQLGNAIRFASCALIIASFTPLHNAWAAGIFLPATASGGQNLYIGQARANEDGTYHAPDFVRPNPEFEQQDFLIEAQKRAGRELDAAQASSFWAAEAFSEMRADPAAAIARTWRKLRLALHQVEMPDNDDIELAATWSPILRLPVFWMGQLVPLAFLGAIVEWRRKREVRVVAGAWFLYLSTLLLFFVVGRFRLPMVPAVIVLATVGARWCVHRVRERDFKHFAPAALAMTACFIGCNWRPDWMEQHRLSSLAIGYNNVGGQLLAAQDFDGAIEMYERAVATSPKTVVAAFRTLGDLYLERRDYDRAEWAMNSVLEHKPDSALGRRALARLHEAMSADLRAKSRSYRADGKFVEAIASLQEVLRIGPYDENQRYLLGNLMEEHSAPEQMVQYWQAQVASDPKPQTSLYFWAVGLERSGQPEAALNKLAEALRVDPAHEMSELRRCAILLERDDYQGALASCDNAVAIFPEYRAAHELRARILDTLGRTQQADAAREAARKSNPSTPKRFLYWGRYLLSAGRPDLALPELQNAVNVDPSDRDATELLARASERVRPGITGVGSQQARALQIPQTASPCGIKNSCINFEDGKTLDKPRVCP